LLERFFVGQVVWVEQRELQATAEWSRGLPPAESEGTTHQGPVPTNGQHYYAFTNAASISFFQLEPDVLYHGQTMMGIGRYLLFETINPSPKVRIVLEMTDTLQWDSENKLPPVAAIGTERLPFGIAGRGSMRRCSPPIVPQKIDGHDYNGIDMGRDGQHFREVRTGLMTLYGTDIRRDHRAMVGFARDISLISEEEYAQMKPPGSLSVFPQDLTNPTLEYSGIYEDGWLSEAAFFRLRQPANTRDLVIRGLIPQTGIPDFTSDVVVLLDGQTVARQSLKLGDFEIRVPSQATEMPHQIELRFSRTQNLSYADTRLIAALSKLAVKPRRLRLGRKGGSCYARYLYYTAMYCIIFRMKQERLFKSNRNVVYSCKYHIIFCPKYRRKVLVNGVDTRLKAIIGEVASDMQVEVIELEIMPDHVHVLCEIDPQLGVHKFVKQLKGRSSRLLRQEYGWLRSRLPTLWTNAYFVATVGGAPLAVIKQYIENQKSV
jgi:putative transposase